MTNKIIDYKIVGDIDSFECWSEISKHIKEGWQPYGYLFERGNFLLQAMVMYENEKVS